MPQPAGGVGVGAALIGVGVGIIVLSGSASQADSLSLRLHAGADEIESWVHGLGVDKLASLAVFVSFTALSLFSLPGTIAVVTFLGGYVPYIGAWTAGAFAVLIALGGEGPEVAVGNGGGRPPRQAAPLVSAAVKISAELTANRSSPDLDPAN